MEGGVCPRRVPRASRLTTKSAPQSPLRSQSSDLEPFQRWVSDSKSPEANSGLLWARQRHRGRGPGEPGRRVGGHAWGHAGKSWPTNRALLWGGGRVSWFFPSKNPETLAVRQNLWISKMLELSSHFQRQRRTQETPLSPGPPEGSPACREGVWPSPTGGTAGVASFRLGRRRRCAHWAAGSCSVPATRRRCGPASSGPGCLSLKMRPLDQRSLLRPFAMRLPREAPSRLRAFPRVHREVSAS